MRELVAKDDVIETVHKAIMQYFDYDDKSPMTEIDKSILSLNKSICNKIKAMEDYYIEDSVYLYCAEHKLSLVSMESIDTFLKICSSYATKENKDETD